MMAFAQSAPGNNALEAFVRAATGAAATVTLVERTSGAVARALSEATHGAHSIVLVKPEGFPPDLLAEFCPAALLLDPSDDELAMAGAGVTGAFAGVASTGSVCIEIGASLSAAASLLMPLHVVLLAAERLVWRPRDLFRPDGPMGGGVGRSFVFTTGPSATADMGPLVRGVHGPHRLHIVVVQ